MKLRGILMLAYFALSACAPAEYSAPFTLGNSPLTLSVQLRQTHDFFAEYGRTLVLENRNGPASTVELSVDSGGYTLVNLYQVAEDKYSVRTMGNDWYVVRLDDAVIETLSDTTINVLIPSPEEDFIGAYDFDDSGNWRFIPAAEREQRELGRIYPR